MHARSYWKRSAHLINQSHTQGDGRKTPKSPKTPTKAKKGKPEEPVEVLGKKHSTLKKRADDTSGAVLLGRLCDVHVYMYVCMTAHSHPESQTQMRPEGMMWCMCCTAWRALM